VSKSHPYSDPFVEAFRASTPYIHAHRGRTFVVVFGGEVVAGEGFPGLIHDIALLQALGIRLVLVHGARPQIEERLRLRGAEIRYVNGLRVTDEQALVCVKEAAGAVRVEVEALLSMGVANSPMAGARLRVASGNFVTARPLGVRDGVDYGHTGVVRRIDEGAIRSLLDGGALVLIPPLGYSPTGEVFNLSAPEVGEAVAVALGADKLIVLLEGEGPRDAENLPLTNATPSQVESLLADNPPYTEELLHHLRLAVSACRRGVKRTHLVSRGIDGALLKELFTRDGAGTLITAEVYEKLRAARIDDVGGILELLAPLEERGILVRRSREVLETEIDRFTVLERDGAIIGCAALYCYPEERVAELACVAVHPDYRSSGRGDLLLGHMERQARERGLRQLFVLTTQTAHWFLERGFQTAGVEWLPVAKQRLYNYRRKSKVFFKGLD